MRGIGVLIRPLGTVPPDVLRKIRSELSSRLDCQVGLGPLLPLPIHGFVRQRRQYLSNVLLKGLERSNDGHSGHKILGVTSQDLFAPGRTFVFGQAIVSGHAAVISTKRLAIPGGSLGSRASKEALHEIGHTMGLAHCEDERCVMAFSESVSEADRKTHQFCDYCSSKLDLGFTDHASWETG